ncbi:MAG: hypothetical protein AAFR59_16730 [Bacteroidota bacterium]
MSQFVSAQEGDSLNIADVNIYYIEGFQSVQGTDLPIRELGVTVGFHLIPNYVGFGAGISRLSFPTRGRAYLFPTWQIRGFFNSERTYYYSYRQTQGRGSDSYSDYRITNREFNLGYRIGSYVILGGGVSFLRQVQKLNQLAGTVYDYQGATLTGRLIVTLDNARRRSWDPPASYGYLIIGAVAAGRGAYVNARERWRQEITGHIGGGVKVSSHWGVGLGISAIGYSRIGDESYIRRLQGAGVQVAGIWPHVMGMVELGYAFNIIDGYGIQSEIYRFSPGQNGQGTYFRFTVGPRIGKFTLQASYLTTPRLKGRERYDFLVNAGEWDVRQEVNYRVISGVQLGIGVFVDAD